MSIRDVKPLVTNGVLYTSRGTYHHPHPWETDDDIFSRAIRAEEFAGNTKIIIALGEGTAEDAYEKMLQDQREKFTG